MHDPVGPERAADLGHAARVGAAEHLARPLDPEERGHVALRHHRDPRPPAELAGERLAEQLRGLAAGHRRARRAAGARPSSRAQARAPPARAQVTRTVVGSHAGRLQRREHDEAADRGERLAEEVHER